MLLHTCSSAACQAAPVRADDPDRKRHFTVDLHCHTLSLAAEKLVELLPQKAAEPQFMRKAMGEDSAQYNMNTMLPACFPKLTRIEDRLADMDAMGVDVQVVSASPGQYYYWAPADLACDIVRTVNEDLAELCAVHPDRLLGLGTVSLQHPVLACDQIEHAMKTLGFKGVIISTSVEGRELADPSLTPFWARAEQLGAVVFIHPLGTTLGERLNRHYLSNVIGQPLETTIALSHLIFGGVLDSHPGLKILAAHGGGYLPTYAGRSDHAFAARPDAATQTRTPPSAQLKRIWYDNVVFDPVAVRHLADNVGISQIVVGTDYPYDMGQYTVHQLMDAVPGLSEDDRCAILGRNAAALLGLPEVLARN